MKIAVVAPHRDDAAFALGLTVGHWLEQGHAVEVINCFTRSDFAPYSDAESLHPNDRMSFVSATLKREVESWVKQYRGKLTLTELNLKDAPLRLHIAPEEVYGLSVNQADKSLSKLQKALEQSRAAAVVVPLALGGHIDHLTAREGALQGRAEGVAMAFYEDLPYALEAGEDGIEAAAEQISGSVKERLAPWFVRDTAAGESIEPAIARRRKLALCFDSQVDTAMVEAIAGYCGRYQGRERLWANQSWRAAFAGASSV